MFFLMQKQKAKRAETEKQLLAEDTSISFKKVRSPQAEYDRALKVLEQAAVIPKTASDIVLQASFTKKSSVLGFKKRRDLFLFSDGSLAYRRKEKGPLREIVLKGLASVEVHKQTMTLRFASSEPL